MTARATIHSHSVEDRLAIPVQAIEGRERESYCRVRRGGEWQRIPIQIGHSNDQWCEVLEGVGEGEEIALVPMGEVA